MTVFWLEIIVVLWLYLYISSIYDRPLEYYRKHFTAHSYLKKTIYNKITENQATIGGFIAQERFLPGRYTREKGFKAAFDAMFEPHVYTSLRSCRKSIVGVLQQNGFYPQCVKNYVLK